MSKAAPIAWIAVDWGTSNLRVWGMSAQGHVIHTASSSQGMASLTPELYESALLGLISDWLPSSVKEAPIPVIACGMVGAKQGWIEVPYQIVPAHPLSLSHWKSVKTHNQQIAVYILGGLCQAKPADVMRGEETQIAGLLSSNPTFEGVVCLPGTHSKWVRFTSDQKVQSFQTFMTGELFALISQQSVLRHTIADSGWDEVAFCEAVKQVIIDPNIYSSQLFSLRAGALLDQLSPVIARSRLSGWLIGSEIMAAQSCWQAQNIYIIGESKLAKMYATALELTPNSSGTITVADTETMTLAGLSAAYASLMKATS